MILFLIGTLSLLFWALLTWVTLGLPNQVYQHIPRPLQTFCANAENGFYYDLPNKSMPTVLFLTLFFLLFVLYAAAIYHIKTSKKSVHLSVIILFAILFRVVSLPGVLIHENDIYRYLWDGKVFKHGINPYKYAPGILENIEQRYTRPVYDLDRGEYLPAAATSNLNETEIRRLSDLKDANPLYFERIGHRWVSTIYPPLLEFVFLLAAVLKQDSIFLFKGLILIFDMGSVLVLVALLKRKKMSPAHVLIYAWSPLIIKEFANSGHADAVAIFFLLLFLLLLDYKKYFCSCISLVCAGLSKFFPFLLLPLLWRRWPQRYAFLTVGISLLVYLPFFFWQQTGFVQVFEGLTVYSKLWMFNGAFYSIVFHLFGANRGSIIWSKLVCATVLLCLLGWIIVRKDRLTRDITWEVALILAALFLLNPVGDPWYYSWVVPFLCFYPWISLIALSCLLMLSYLTFNPDYHQLLVKNPQGMPWLLMLQYVPFYVLLFIELYRTFERKHV